MGGRMRPYVRPIQPIHQRLKSTRSHDGEKKRGRAEPRLTTQTSRPYLVHVGVKVGPILKVDLHCWVHGEG